MIDNTPFNIPDLDCDMAWFLGLFISSQRLFSNDFKTLSLLVDYNKDIIEKVKTQLKRFGDYEVSVHINTKNTTCIYIVNVPHLALYFDKNILHVNCRDDEELPNFIKEATKDIRLAFIAGILDGYMEYKFPEIPLSLTQQIQTLCYSCGFETRIVDNKIVPASDHSKYILSRIPYYKAKKDFDNIEIEFDESLLHAVKVINIEYLDEEEETFDIEVRYEHEFFCNGYLTHNSAQISLGDPDDIDYLRAKRWDLGNIPNWRAMSNNSVVCSSIDELPEEFWINYTGIGEPYGLINIELSKKIGRIADGDKYPDPDVEGYNPCFSSETLVAVADGRGAVTIKQLADEGKDVPVYSVNEEGIVEIKWGRNPRITGHNQKMVKVILDDDTSITTTLNHKFYLKSGGQKEAKDLEHGDSLVRLNKYMTKMSSKNNKKYIQVYTDTNNDKNGRIMEHRLISKFYDNKKWNEMYNENKNNGWVNGGLVVHHKDYNSYNNSPTNLELMTFKEHTAFHAQHDVQGEKNGMYGKQHSEETKKNIGDKVKERCEDPEYRIKLSNGQKLYVANNLEQVQDKMRQVTKAAYAKYCEEQIALTDLETLFVKGILHCKKNCENCEKELILPYTRREQCYCSHECWRKTTEYKEGLVLSNVRQCETHIKRQKNVLHEQIMIYKDLQEKLNRDPMKKEWENECKVREIAFRIRPPSDLEKSKINNQYILKSYKDLKEKAVDYNHRVKRIEFLEEPETVYNITVEDNHNFFVVPEFNGNDKNLNGVLVSNCGEISLPNKSVCCLSEIFLQNVDSLEEMIDIAKILYRICKHVLLLKCHNKDTEDIVHKEMRIGLGVTGYLMVSEEKKQWLPKVYEELRKFDIEYSDLKKIPRSIKLTSVKPSGTLSLLAGSTPGCHSAIYRYFIRRIRISSTNPLVQVCKDHGFHTEYQLNFDGTHDYNTIVTSFPCSFPDEAVLAENMTVIKQLEVVKRMQTEWSDNAVSVTCYYKLEELDEIKQWLRENFTNNVKSVSFLLHYDSGFKQMPYEEITKEKYLDLKSKTRTIKSMTYKNQNIIDDIEDNFECAGGHCPIK